MSQVLTARYVPLMWVFPISVIELRRSLELGPNMQGRNSEDLLSELEEIKQENQKKWAELDNLLTLGNYGGMCFKEINDQLVMLHGSFYYRFDSKS